MPLFGFAAFDGAGYTPSQSRVISSHERLRANWPQITMPVEADGSALGRQNRQHREEGQFDGFQPRVHRRFAFLARTKHLPRMQSRPHPQNRRNSPNL